MLILIAGLVAAFNFNATNVYLKSGESSSFVNFTYNSQNYYMMKINGQESMIFQSNNTPVTDQNTINQLLSAYFSNQFSQLPFNNLAQQINSSFYNVSFYYGGCLQGIESFLSVPYNTYMLSVIIPNQGYVCQPQWEAYKDMQNITAAQNQSIYNLNQSIQQFYASIQQQDINGVLEVLNSIQTAAQQLDSSYTRLTSDFTTFTNFCGSNNTNTVIIGMFLSPTQQNENISCFYQSFIDQDLKNIANLAQQGNNYNIQNMESQIHTQTIQRVSAAQIEIQRNQSLNEMQSAEALYQKVKNFYAGTSVSTSFLSALELQAQNSLNASNFSNGAIDNFSEAVQQLYALSSQFNQTTYSLSNTLNVINAAIERVGRSDPRVQQAQQNYTSIEEKYKNLSQELSNGLPVTASQLQAIQIESDSLANYTSSLQPPENQFGWLQIIAVIIIVIVIIIVLFYFKKFKKEPPKITDLSTEYSLNAQQNQKLK